MNISLGSWSFISGQYANDPKPLEQVIARLSEAEFDGIELSGAAPHASLNAYATPGSRSELRRVLTDYGLAVSGYSADFSNVDPGIHRTRETYIDLFQRMLDLCAEIGGPSIRLDSADPTRSTPLSSLAEVWRICSELAEAANVRMLWEFKARSAFNKPSEILAVHKEVAHPNFQILFDTSHAYACCRMRAVRDRLQGGLPELLKKLEGRIGAIHLGDSDGTLLDDGSSYRCPFDEGHIDFRMLAPQLLDVPGIDWWCVDLGTCAGAWDLIDSSRDFVLELLDSKAAA